MATVLRQSFRSKGALIGGHFIWGGVASAFEASMSATFLTRNTPKILSALGFYLGGRGPKRAHNFRRLQSMERPMMSKRMMQEDDMPIMRLKKEVKRKTRSKKSKKSALADEMHRGK